MHVIFRLKIHFKENKHQKPHARIVMMHKNVHYGKKQMPFMRKYGLCDKL